MNFDEAAKIAMSYTVSRAISGNAFLASALPTDGSVRGATYRTTDWATSWIMEVATYDATYWAFKEIKNEL